MIGQKGIDLILELLPPLLARGGVQLVLQGTGERTLERRAVELAQAYPGRLGVNIGYDEAHAHLIEAGCDIFLMPSRFEPCGLNQMYSLRYGTVPVVHRTGGLADTVVDVSAASLEDGSASGFVFDEASAGSLWDAIERALNLYHGQPAQWRALMRNGMAADLSWESSARAYQTLYAEALDSLALPAAARSA
jgi:starch synthase